MVGAPRGNCVHRETGSLFAAAEEFAHLIDDASSWGMTGSNALANTDNAGVCVCVCVCVCDGRGTKRVLCRKKCCVDCATVSVHA